MAFSGPTLLKMPSGAGRGGGRKGNDEKITFYPFRQAVLDNILPFQADSSGSLCGNCVAVSAIAQGE